MAAVVAGAMVALAALLTVFSNGYGFHRDELYFRMLHPAWGYVDQGPFTPLLARFLSYHVAQEPWAIRMPATLSAVSSVLVVTLITRELGGTRRAQILCAWGYAFAGIPLVFGHLMITSTFDMVVWPLVSLFIIRAVLRNQARWWMLAGIVVGLSMYNKLLVAILLASFVVAIAAVGPRKVLWSRWAILSGLLALAIGAPNIVYQATNGWPELSMGRALMDENASSVRIGMWPLAILLLGPPLVPVWVAGIVSLWRRPAWRRVRFVGVAFPVLLVIVFAMGSQSYYPAGLLAVLFAAGCIPTADWLARRKPWRVLMVVGIVLNGCVSALIGLPLVPVDDLGSTPIPQINQAARDQVGWPQYVNEIATAYDKKMPKKRQRHAVVIASNYGEAGAVARYRRAVGLPAVYAAHNGLYWQGEPSRRAKNAIVVGGEYSQIKQYFKKCKVVGHLDNGVGVDNEEQGEPIAVCKSLQKSWTVVWPKLYHLG